MVRVGIPGTLSFLTFYPLWKPFFEELGARVTDNKLKIARVIWQAKYGFSQYRKPLLHGLTPAEAFTLLESGEELAAMPDDKPVKLAVLGYPYAIYDNYISVGLLETLKEHDVTV